MFDPYNDGWLRMRGKVNTKFSEELKIFAIFHLLLPIIGLFLQNLFFHCIHLSTILQNLSNVVLWSFLRSFLSFSLLDRLSNYTL